MGLEKTKHFIWEEETVGRKQKSEKKQEWSKVENYRNEEEKEMVQIYEKRGEKGVE